ncbi:MAG TPA: winged helix DNA-binding domain-containing protein [Actinomycetota bacterium]|nr:winged helix DNA-binding domain-containing protein [Actinomycetota bacterium]
MRAGEVMRRRMRASRLVGSGFGEPADVVRHHGAMQAQDYAPAKWSIGQRARDLADADVDAAIADGSIVRTHVLRPTWHFVAREDLRWLLALTGPRVEQRSAPRYRDLGLDARTLVRCERAIVRALEGGNHLTREAIGDALHVARIDTSGQRLPWVLMHCELEALICSGPRAGKHHTYALFDERVPAAAALDRDDALVELARGYLASHGPATVRDLSWWSSLPVADLRRALHDLDAREESVDGVALWSIDGDSKRAPTLRGVRLLQPYDELVVGYTESRYLGDPRRDAALAAWRDRTLPNGIVLVNGRLGGFWRRRVAGKWLSADVVLYDDLSPAQAPVLDAEIRRLSRFVGGPVRTEIRRLN